MKIIFSGGGTLGPVTPLLAIHDCIKEKYPDVEAIWIGTKQGPERWLVEKRGLLFMTITSGKFRRYFSFLNIVDLGKIIIGFFQSFMMLWHEEPDVCVSAGGFVSVPLHFAAWILGIPTWIHQQDVHVGLANRLLVPWAKKITTSLEYHLRLFPKKKTTWLGNPVREEILLGNKEKAYTIFSLDRNLPVVLAMGGGTGSMRLNQFIIQALPSLQGFCQVIHLSGKERPQELVERGERLFNHYHLYQFLDDDLKHAYAAADIVISRGGFGALSEIAALGKPGIFVPKPGHQEENVRYLVDAGAALEIDEELSDGNVLAKTVRQLLQDKEKQKQLGAKLHVVLPQAKPREIIEVLDQIHH